MLPEATLRLTEPVNAVMPALPQDILTVFCYIVYAGCLVVAFRNIAKNRDDSFLILCLAGATGFLLDPFVCFLTKALHAPVGQYTMLRAFGKPAPYYLLPMYGFYLACPAYFFNRAFKANPTPALFWKTFANLFVAVCIFELGPLHIGIWMYYGYQPFVFMKFPVYVSLLNATLVLAFSATSLICLEIFSGLRRWLLLLLSPMTGYAVYAGAGWPVAMALQGDVGYPGARLGAVGTAVLSLTACYFILRVMLLIVKNLKTDATAAEKIGVLNCE